MTPAEEQGWAVGDRGVVREGSGTFTKGSMVEFVDDDGSGNPLFRLLHGDSTVLCRTTEEGPEDGAYCGIQFIKRLDRRGRTEA